jgi:4-diphosphocytidyl-2-C-methyl-D-erythritol kinase
MITFPNAKINIGLNIIEKRSDGFHNIESVFYPVGWKDVLEISPTEASVSPNPSSKERGVLFASSGLEIPGSTENNLILKAYNLINSEFRIQNPELIKVHLHKVIPMGAGMGGGSADGAFALKMFNEIYELGLSNNELRNFARKLGSDCAFFIENKPVFCHQKGDQFEDFDLDLKGMYIVLVNPNIHISTAEAYSGVTPQKPKISLKEALKLPINEWKNVVKNDFEEKLLIKYPTIAQIKQNLYDAQAVYASMTGSGSTVYGIFSPLTPKGGTRLRQIFNEFSIWEGYL